MKCTWTPQGFEVDVTWTDAEHKALQAEILAIEKHGYYQKIIIRDRAGKSISTPGQHMTTDVIKVLDAHGFPASFAGQSVLDIGCNAGFYTTIAKLRGATRALGIDVQPHYIAHALFVRRVLGLSESEIEFRTDDGHALSPDGEKFDVVINTGVVYHLQNPMDFLCKVAAVTRQMMILESEMLTDPKFDEHAWFIEGAYGADTSNWWIYGPKCLERMARAAGFRDVKFCGFVWKAPQGMLTPEGHQRQGRGFFLCRK